MIIAHRICAAIGGLSRSSRLVFFVMLAGVVLTVLSLPSAALQSSPQEPEPLAREIVAQLAARHFSDVEAHFDERMHAGLPVEKLGSVWDSLLGQAGAFHRITGAEVSKQQSVSLVIVHCEFEHAALDAKIAIDGQGHVAGLFFTPAATSPAGNASSWSAPAFANPAMFRERDVTVGDGRLKLPGTLTLPLGEGPFAAIVLVHGSGPEDADETIGPNKPFKDLAWGLASRKIAVLRYVKRTKQYRSNISATGAYTVKDETMDDADAAVALLTRLPEIDHRHVYVLGHSLGGMLAPRIAAANPNVAGIIIAAGTARPLQRVIVEQLIYLARLHDQPSDDSKNQIAAAERAEVQIDDPALKADSTIDLLGAEIPASYFLDLRAYHPLEAAAALKVPILVLQGGRDYQVTTQDYDLWKSALGKDQLASFRFYPALTHLFMTGTGSGAASPADYEVAGHVSAQVVQDVAMWVQGRSAQGDVSGATATT